MFRLVICVAGKNTCSIRVAAGQCWPVEPTTADFLYKCLQFGKMFNEYFVLLSYIISLFSCSSADEDETPNPSNEDEVDVGVTRRYRSQRRDKPSPVVRSTVQPLLEPVSRPTFSNLLFDVT